MNSLCTARLKRLILWTKLFGFLCKKKKERNLNENSVGKGLFLLCLPNHEMGSFLSTTDCLQFQLLKYLYFNLGFACKGTSPSRILPTNKRGHRKESWEFLCRCLRDLEQAGKLPKPMNKKLMVNTDLTYVQMDIADGIISRLTNPIEHTEALSFYSLY